MPTPSSTHDELGVFLAKYEKMVKRQDAEDKMTTEYLFEVFERLGGATGSEQGGAGSSEGGVPSLVAPPPTTSLNPIYSSAVPRRRLLQTWNSITAGGDHKYTADDQLGMVMDALRKTDLPDGSTVSFAEFVQAYKAIIITMQALDLCPSTAPSATVFRIRTRSRLEAFLQTLGSTQLEHDAQSYLHDSLDEQLPRPQEECGALLSPPPDAASADLSFDEGWINTSGDEFSAGSLEGSEQALLALLAEKDRQLASFKDAASAAAADRDMPGPTLQLVLAIASAVSIAFFLGVVVEHRQTSTCTLNIQENTCGVEVAQLRLRVQGIEAPAPSHAAGSWPDEGGSREIQVAEKKGGRFAKAKRITRNTSLKKKALFVGAGILVIFIPRLMVTAAVMLS